MRHRLLHVTVALVLVLGCPASRRAAEPLPGSFETPEALAGAVLDALARNDRAALEALALSEPTFYERVWPELPASRRERNLPADYVWQDLHQKSRAHLAQTLAAHGGVRYTLERIKFLGGTTAYRSFRVSRHAELHVRDESGAARSVRLFGSVLESGSRHVVFSFVID